MPMKAGTTADFADSMAAAIEGALQREWPAVMGADQSLESNPQLRLLCIAVAQGVVRYLSDHAADIQVTNETGGAHSHTLTTRLSVTGELY